MTEFLTLRPSRRWYGVLTPDGLLIWEADGTRRRIEWEKVLAAKHATTTGRGTRWRLKLDEGWSRSVMSGSPLTAGVSRGMLSSWKLVGAGVRYVWTGLATCCSTGGQCTRTKYTRLPNIALQPTGELW